MKKHATGVSNVDINACTYRHAQRYAVGSASLRANA